jgi:drug/metabolite transporter (DMT)-like permease
MGVFGSPRGLAARTGSPAAQAVLSCICYATCSTALTLANKAIFSDTQLNYPWSLLAIQSIVSALALGVFYGVREQRWPVKPTLLRELARPCAVFTLYIFTNARALRYISLPMLSVVKSLAPMGIAMVERLLYGERLSGGTYGAMGLILLSNVVTVTNDVEFHLWGYVWAGLNALFNVMYVVFLRYFVTNKHSPGEKTLHNNILISCIMIPTAVAAGEGPGFVRDFALTSLRFRALFALSCLLAVGIGASVFWVLNSTSGSTLSFVGGANKVFVVILGAFLFNARITPSGWVGVFLGVLASIAFSVSKARTARAAADKAADSAPEDDTKAGLKKVAVRSVVSH